MSKLKGITKLNNTISAQLASFGISKAFLSTDYAYYWEQEKVSYKLTETVEDEWFCEFINERFGYMVKYPMVMALLHEIGHHMTDDDLGDVVEDFCEVEKERIDKEMLTADEDYSKVLEWQYFNLPDEIIATAWAVNYAKQHPQKIRKMHNTILNALMEFYTINNLTED